MGGLVKILNYEINDNHNTVNIWSKQKAYNLTEVIIDNMIKQGFKLSIVTVSGDTVGYFGGGYTHKPLLIFSDATKY